MVGGSQILIIIAIIVVVFIAPKSLPGLGRSLGDAIRGFKKGISGEEDDEIDVTSTAQEKLHQTESQATTSQKTEKEKA